MNKTALYAGSFDPITNGHLDIIERAAKLFDKLIVCVVINPNKKASFTLELRKEMIAKCVKNYDNIEIDSHTGLLADYVNENKIDVVIRGIRNTLDYENELQMANINQSLYRGDTETVFFMARPNHSYISSSAVKEVASYGGDISNMVPSCNLEDIKKVEE